MVRHGLGPDRVLCSTAQRARQTFELIAEQFPDPPPVTFVDGLYNAPPDDIIQIIRTPPNDVRSLLVIGHNPGLQAAAAMLIAAGDVEARERLKEKLPTAGLAVIDFPSDAWGKVHRSAGRLERFVTPRMIETATD
jgi:phosphohistidine phosphatase